MDHRTGPICIINVADTDKAKTTRLCFFNNGAEERDNEFLSVYTFAHTFTLMYSHF